PRSRQVPQAWSVRPACPRRSHWWCRPSSSCSSQAASPARSCRRRAARRAEAAMFDLLFDPSFAASIPRFVAPILLAALGGAVCERAGIFNIALEGFILVGAFAAVAGSYFTGSAYLGAATAMAGGVLIGLLFAEFNLRRGGDPIVVSIAINILA